MVCILNLKCRKLYLHDEKLDRIDILRFIRLIKKYEPVEGV